MKFSKKLFRSFFFWNNSKTKKTRDIKFIIVSSNLIITNFMNNISSFISNAMIMTLTKNFHRQTSHAKNFFKSFFQNRKKTKKKTSKSNQSSNNDDQKAKFRKRFFHKKIAFHQTNISKIEMNIDKTNMIKIVTNIKTKIAIMIKNAIKTNIARKLVITNDLTLNFKMLNFKKRTRIIMSMKISMRMTNHTKK